MQCLVVLEKGSEDIIFTEACLNIIKAVEEQIKSDMRLLLQPISDPANESLQGDP